MTEALLCLSLTIFFEARDQTLEGQRAVAQVVMNRAGQDPARVCTEVFRPRQFSAFNALTGAEQSVRDERVTRYMRVIEREPRAWATAKRIAEKAINGQYQGIVNGANHYHTSRVAPRWNRGMEMVAQVGDHVFWKR
jgi:spore germination cell wall hydrolase CwlJ-like protein